MYIVVIAWAFVVLLMALAEALSPQGSVLGALITLLLYGVLPLAIVVYLMGAPARRRWRQAQEASTTPPDGRPQPAGDPVAPKREEA